MKFSTLIPASVFALLLAACGGPEGTYKLDKDAMKKSLEAETKDKDAAGLPLPWSRRWISRSS